MEIFNALILNEQNAFHEMVETASVEYVNNNHSERTFEDIKRGAILCRVNREQSDIFELNTPQQLAWLMHDSYCVPFEDNDPKNTIRLLDTLIEFEEVDISVEDINLSKMMILDILERNAKVVGSDVLIDMSLQFLAFASSIKEYIERIRYYFMLTNEKAEQIFKDRFTDIIKRDNIYFTDYGKTHWEDSAKRNLSKFK